MNKLTPKKNEKVQEYKKRIEADFLDEVIKYDQEDLYEKFDRPYSEVLDDLWCQEVYGISHKEYQNKIESLQEQMGVEL